MRSVSILLLLLGTSLATAAPSPISFVPPELDPGFSTDLSEFTVAVSPTDATILTGALTTLESSLDLLHPLTTTPSSLSTIFNTFENTTTTLSDSRLAPTLLCRDDWSSSAPHKSEVHCAANRLIAENPGTCLQTHNACEPKKSCDRAHITICGVYNHGVKCSTLAWAAKHIANNCEVGAAGNKRSRGTYRFLAAKVSAVVS